MLTDKQRLLLWLIDQEFETVNRALFKASIYFEKLDSESFKNTLEEIKAMIKDIIDSKSKLIDFMNEQDFPVSEDKEESKACALYVDYEKSCKALKDRNNELLQAKESQNGNN